MLSAQADVPDVDNSADRRMMGDGRCRPASGADSNRRGRPVLVRRRDGLYIDDLGSLNGTYVNRRRIESHRLQNGDELQVGKYKLTYLDR